MGYKLYCIYLPQPLPDKRSCFLTPRAVFGSFTPRRSPLKPPKIRTEPFKNYARSLMSRLNSFHECCSPVSAKLREGEFPWQPKMQTYSPEGRYAHTTKLGIFAHFALYSARHGARQFSTDYPWFVWLSSSFPRSFHHRWKTPVQSAANLYWCLSG